MANEEHLRMLKQGVEVWNRWREENPDTLPDFNGADLSDTRLRGADLSGAALFVANLRRADLHAAVLNEVLLADADLSDANLSGARLGDANLSGANLSGADFSRAFVGDTVFAGVDLSVARGLETIQHGRRSYVDIHTIYRSGGKIPEAFLRGCGVPDPFITYIASLTSEAIQYYSCFISYSHKDEAFAARLYNDLQGKGIRCWFAPEDMKIGDEIRSRIDQSIRLHDKLLVVLSEHSIGSDWVEDEVETALEEERKRKQMVLFPIRLDEAVMETDEAWAAKIRRTRHIGDFRRWKDHDSYQEAFERLLQDLKTD